MAEVYLLKRDFTDALELYESLIQEVPDSPKLWNERASSCIRRAAPPKR